MEIHLARVYYPVKTLGPGVRLGIWTTGCPHQCRDCISPELKNLEAGNKVDIDAIIAYIEQNHLKFDGVTISGGDPFYQPEALLTLLERLQKYTEDIIVYTGYHYEELMESNNKDITNALQYISVLIEGPYIPEQNHGKGLRGSDNQKIVIQKYQEKYIDLENMERKIQTILYGDKLLEIGIPGGMNSEHR